MSFGERSRNYELKGLKGRGAEGQTLLYRSWQHRPSVGNIMMRTIMPKEPEWFNCADREPGFPNQALTVASSDTVRCQFAGEGVRLIGRCRSSSPRRRQGSVRNNLHQIGITHRNRGSIHEALKHRASDDVLVICYKQ
jgi:hypothetical protein